MLDIFISRDDVKHVWRHHVKSKYQALHSCKQKKWEKNFQFADWDYLDHVNTEIR